ESDFDAGRKSLSVALTALRRELEPEGVPRGSVLIADRFAVRLEARRVGTDVRSFLSRLAAARQAADARREELLAEAAELYSGPLLPGYYEEWVTREQERLASIAYQTLCELSELRQSRRDQEAALAWARRAVE